MAYGVIAQLNKDLSNFDAIITSYEKSMDGWKDNLRINGKNLESANIEQPTWIAYYDQLKVDMKILTDYMDMLVKERRAKMFRIISQNQSYDYTDNAKNKLIDDDEGYIALNKRYLVAKEMYLKLDSIVTCFSQRSFSLNNIVKIREKELENITVFINNDYE